MGPSLLFIALLIFNPYLENNYGRKTMVFISVLATGVSLLLTLAVPDGAFAYNWPIIALLYIGQMFCANCFTYSYSYTRELFPTSLRSSTMGFASAMARVGSMVSSSIAPLEEINVLIPFLVYGVISFIGAVLCVWINPETKDLNLPDTLEEAETNAKSPNPWLRCRKGRKNQVGISEKA